MTIKTIKTILHAYEFDVRKPKDKAAWEALKAKLATGPHCFGPVLSDVFYSVRDLDGQTIELETKHLFGNQWNTAGDKGRRVFDWALCSHIAGCQISADNAPSHIRRGHYLEQTDEMRELRRNTNACGYCGHQEAAQRGTVFCPKCIDSEYLKLADLHLTRMVSIEEADALSFRRAELSDAERAHLVPLYIAAQTHGSTERGKARMLKKRAEVAATYAAKTANAKTEHDGLMWLLDHGISADPIFYTHTGRFGFGWRTPLDAEAVSALLEAMGAEFAFPYDIKCADGRTLSGN